MGQKLQFTYTSDTWDEKIVVNESPKIANVITKRTVFGDLKGQGVAVYTMIYLPSGNVVYNGIFKLEAKIQQNEEIKKFVFITEGLVDSHGSLSAQWKLSNHLDGSLKGSGGYAMGLDSQVKTKQNENSAPVTDAWLELE